MTRGDLSIASIDSVDSANPRDDACRTKPSRLEEIDETDHVAARAGVPLGVCRVMAVFEFVPTKGGTKTEMCHSPTGSYSPCATNAASTLRIASGSGPWYVR